MRISFKPVIRNAYNSIHLGIGQVYGLVPSHFREGKIFRETQELLGETEFWSKERHQEMQLRQLRSLLIHANKNVPYYQRLFIDHKINPHELVDFSDYEKIPFLTKEIIRNNIEDLKANNFSENDFESVTTGGSSGIPLKFYLQKGFSSQRENAFIENIWRRVGFRWGRDKRLVLRGSIIENQSRVQYKPSRKELICSTYHMDDFHLYKYYKCMVAMDIRYIHGHVSSIVLFAQFLIKNGLSYNLNAVLGGSEKVFPFQRELIKKAFKCRLYSWYGQSEQVILASECEYSNNYHIFPQYGITELIDDYGNQIDENNKTGEIVGTSFNNYVMPLIRYRTSDIGSFASTSCSCGRDYKLFQEIEGRSNEYIFTKEGNKISLTGLIFGQHFQAFENIKKMQIYQEDKGLIEIRIVKSSEFTRNDEEEISKIINNAVPEGLSVTFNYQNEIPLTKRGKHRFLIQEIHAPIPKHIEG